MLFIFVMMDRLKNYNPAADGGKMIAMSSGVGAPASARVLVLVIDSLRYETAMDADLMPCLAALRAEGVSARVTNIYSGVSVPSMFTLFTGRENVSLLGFVTNFVSFSSPQVESLFSQLQAAGVASTVSAGTEFMQFGPAIESTVRRDPRRSYEWNVERMLEVAGALARSERSLVVVHVPYTDYAAHSYGVGHERYRQQFHWVDSLIPQFRAKLPPGAVLVVLGDHGHTQDGHHGTGLWTPTASVYVGGPFRQGVDLGTINLASNRYLLNGAFGLPVPAGGYAGEVYPGAFLRGAQAEQSAGVAAPIPHLRAIAGAQFIWLGFGVMVVVWLNVALAEWSPLHFRGWHHGVTMLGLTAAWLPLAWGGLVTLGAGGLVLALAARTPASWRRRLGWTAGLVAGAWAMHGWGRLLGATESVQQAFPLRGIAAVWIVIGIAGIAAAALRFDRVRWTWICLAVPGLLLMPTNGPYGWTSLVVPVLLCWFAQRVVAVARERRDAGRPFTGRELAACAVLALGLFGLLQAEAVTLTVNHAFRGWQALIPALGADNLLFMATVGVVANFILLCPAAGSRPTQLLALGLAVALCPLQWRLWSLVPAQWLALLFGSLAAGLLARGRRHAAARPLLLWFGLLLWLYTMRPPQPNHALVCCLMAALVLGARFVQRFPQPAADEADRALLVLLGTVVAGHALCRWSIMDLEWRAVYDWLAAPQAERFAALILVGLIAKGLVPWWIMRQTIAGPQAGAGEVALPSWTRTAMTIKCVSLLMLMTGLGFVRNATLPYIEAAQQMAVLGMLTLYCLMARPRAATRPGSAR